jgi:hypothetical protein
VFNATTNQPSFEKYRLLKKIATNTSAKSTTTFTYEKLQKELNKIKYQQTADLIERNRWNKKPTLGSGIKSRKSRKGRRR